MTRTGTPSRTDSWIQVRGYRSSLRCRSCGAKGGECRALWKHKYCKARDPCWFADTIHKILRSICVSRILRRNRNPGLPARILEAMERRKASHP